MTKGETKQSVDYGKLTGKVPDAVLKLWEKVGFKLGVTEHTATITAVKDSLKDDKPGECVMQLTIALKVDISGTGVKTDVTDDFKVEIKPGQNNSLWWQHDEVMEKGQVIGWKWRPGYGDAREKHLPAPEPKK